MRSINRIHDAGPGRRSVRGKLRVVSLGLILLVAGVLIYAIGASAAKEEPRKEAGGGEQPQMVLPDVASRQFRRAERGPLLISLLVPGTIQTRNTTSIINMLEGDAKLIWVVNEGVLVKKGDKLVELEATGLDDRIYSQRIDVLRSEADLNNAQQELKLQEQDNLSSLLTTENAVKVGELEMKKYAEGTMLQDKMSKQADIKLADLDLQRAQERLTWTNKLLEKGYVSSGEKQADELTVERNRIELEKTQNALSVFDKYESESEQLKLRNTLLEAQSEWERAKQDNQFKLRSKQIAVERTQAELDHEKSRLAELEEQKANTVLYAPQDGMVVYANNRDRFSSFVVEIGADVRNRQKMLELPDFSSWQVEARVHESMIQQVVDGQHAYVRIDAFPDQQFEASVYKISMMPDTAGRWTSPDVKEYVVNLDLKRVDLPLKPGMTAKTEIILDDQKDVLNVPIQCVSAVGDETFVFVNKGTALERRTIKVGKANDAKVVVLSGLNEGEELLLLAQSGGIEGLTQRPSRQRNGGARGGRPVLEVQGSDNPPPAVDREIGAPGENPGAGSEMPARRGRRNRAGGVAGDARPGGDSAPPASGTAPGNSRMERP